MISPQIVWFRQDLRVQDHPALVQAAQKGLVLPIYILDDENAGENRMGAASRVWLYYALRDLDHSLKGHLHVFRGDAKRVLSQLIEDTQATGLYWGRCYEPWRMVRDKEIKHTWRKLGLEVESFNHSLLWEPWQVHKKDGSPYKVFTPFYRKGCFGAQEPRFVLEPSGDIDFVACEQGEDKLDSLGLLPTVPNWSSTIVKYWDISEQGAHGALEKFLKKGARGYKQGRDFPAQTHVSGLSPYLHFGQLSPHQVWQRVCAAAHAQHLEQDMDHFCSELAWREFSYSLLYYHHDLSHEPLNPSFKHMDWCEDEEALKRWQKGMTGFPLIDAGMRELWQTGYMHNRVRMVVASFLVKNLRVNWQEGARWFWDCLFDADLANNGASWQWVAGCGADAAPYFRIFNPVTQSEKFDPQGEYIRQYVPELAKLPARYIHQPEKAPKDVLVHAGVELGKTYPNAMVDLKTSRTKALQAYHRMKENIFE